MLELPASTNHYEECDEKNPADKYYIGFDPVSERYKLLKIFPGHVEILTIGVDSSWRTVNSHPPKGMTLYSASCLSGILCWDCYVDRVGEQIMAFHLAQEKFIHIPVPEVDAEFDDVSVQLMNLYLIFL
ncbi:OLC1v1024088C1 [Oldenlandia corymbosa var. corymbosa]|uniref:OLC1v1024088C1 n=1 Tax=Oldenlandia corymbosa var. corymbosa TaxID=529605 RepID=A0AAV1C1H0_OLDCO|nr:OLC1v1024088C1 [Oldenlandia corymbosa var. corymbosa]